MSVISVCIHSTTPVSIFFCVAFRFSRLHLLVTCEQLHSHCISLLHQEVHIFQKYSESKQAFLIREQSLWPLAIKRFKKFGLCCTGVTECTLVSVECSVREYINNPHYAVPHSRSNWFWWNNLSQWRYLGKTQITFGLILGQRWGVVQCTHVQSWVALNNAQERNEHCAWSSLNTAQELVPLHHISCGQPCCHRDGD